MKMMTKAVSILGALVLFAPNAAPKPKAPAADEHGSIVIVLKNGRQQSFPLEDVERIEFNSPVAAASAFGRARFLGDWKVGMGGDSRETFLIKLKAEGVAEKIIGSDHTRGTWTIVNGEARAHWDDGWTDVIRKVGGRWEKAAYSDGTSLSGEPTNVAEAVFQEPN